MKSKDNDSESPVTQKTFNLRVLDKLMKHEETIEVKKDNQLRLGNSDDCQIFLDNNRRGRRKTAISFEGGHFLLRNLESLPMVKVNGEEVGRSGTNLKIKDEICIENFFNLTVKSICTSSEIENYFLATFTR